MLVAGWGFGFPHLYSRMCLRHILWYLKAMDSRSNNHYKGLDNPDHEHLLHTMAETHLELHVLPAATAQPAVVDTRVYRPYEYGGVLLAADAAM